MAEISDFKALVAPDVMPCPDPIVNREIVSVLIDFCKKTDVLQKEFNVAMDTTEIDADMQDSLDLDLYEYLGDRFSIAHIIEARIDGVEVEMKEREILNTIEDWDMIKEEGVQYFHIESSTLIRLYDMSTSQTNLYIKVSVKPTRTVETLPDSLFDDWSEVIANGARYNILRMPGKEWTDRESAITYYREYRTGMSEATKERLKDFTNKTQHVHWRSFGEID